MHETLKKDHYAKGTTKFHLNGIKIRIHPNSNITRLINFTKNMKEIDYSFKQNSACMASATMLPNHVKDLFHMVQFICDMT